MKLLKLSAIFFVLTQFVSVPLYSQELQTESAALPAEKNIASESDSLKAALKSDVIQGIREKGYYMKEYKFKEECDYYVLPNTPSCLKAKDSWGKIGKNEEPVYSMEKVFLVKKSEFSNDGVPAGIQKISEVLRSVSKMVGMQYFTSERKWETLYKTAYVIDALETRKRIPDDIEGSADGKEILAYVKDNSFGDCFYRITYHQNEKEFHQMYELAKDLMVGGIIRGVKAGYMKINLIISDIGDEFIVYFLVQSRYSAPQMMEKMVSRSLKARVNAISNWFFSNFDEVDGKNIGEKFEEREE